MDISTIIEGAKTALGDPRAGRAWVRKFIEGMSHDDLVWAATNNFDPVTAVISKYSLDDPNVRKVVTLVLRRYWKLISGELRSVPKIIKRLSKNPKNREALKNPKVVEWLNVTCQRAYLVFYDYAWINNVELVCAHCKSRFLYDVLYLKAVDLNPSEDGKHYRVVICPNCGAELQAVF